MGEETEETMPMQDIQKDVKERLKRFSKERESAESMIAEDKQEYKQLIENQETLKGMVIELLGISKQLEKETETYRKYFKEEKNKIMQEYYKQKLVKSGILRD